VYNVRTEREPMKRIKLSVVQKCLDDAGSTLTPRALVEFCKAMWRPAAFYRGKCLKESNRPANRAGYNLLVEAKTRGLCVWLDKYGEWVSAKASSTVNKNSTFRLHEDVEIVDDYTMPPFCCRCKNYQPYDCTTCCK
jgi:hypothetical protein